VHTIFAYLGSCLRRHDLYYSQSEALTGDGGHFKAVKSALASTRTPRSSLSGESRSFDLDFAEKGERKAGKVSLALVLRVKSLSLTHAGGSTLATREEKAYYTVNESVLRDKKSVFLNGNKAHGIGGFCTFGI